jgi:hypothetical protein
MNMILTRLSKKLRSAVPPPSSKDMRVVRDPNTRLRLPFNRDHTVSSRDMRVPIFVLTHSVSASKSSNSTKHVGRLASLFGVSNVPPVD